MNIGISKEGFKKLFEETNDPVSTFEEAEELFLEYNEIEN